MVRLILAILILTSNCPAKDGTNLLVGSGKHKGGLVTGSGCEFPEATKAEEDRINRILVKSTAIGNLFHPEDEIAFDIRVIANKPLPPGTPLQYTIRDYWGCIQIPLKEIPLTKLVQNEGKFPYHANISPGADQLMQGKFYQLHIGIQQSPGRPAKETPGFAILPKARNKRFQPSEIPFTTRSNDGRPPACYYLADRLGIRTPGLPGGWDSKPPYKPHLPGLNHCAELDMDWITSTPAALVEHNGFTEYSEESLRQGMKNFLEEYADTGLAKIAMGNHPQGTGKKVLDNIRAYKAIYETVKAFDPDIHVIGTTIEPNEEYFRNGYQDYMDSYNFQDFEDYKQLRKRMKEYRALMEKYNAAKPIHSTELGLKGQGRPRIDVSCDMIKKLTSFFAEGGEIAGSFTIQEPKGNPWGSFTDSQSMFDCKYNLYTPRLDAIAHYHYINQVSDKGFVEERHYPEGIQAYLFQDKQGQCLQILWMDARRKDVSIPLPEGTKNATLTYIDGTSQLLANPGDGVTLTISNNPILLSYPARPGARLSKSLGEPSITLEPASILAKPGQPITLPLLSPPPTAHPPFCLPLQRGTPRSLSKARQSWSYASLPRKLPPHAQPSSESKKPRAKPSSGRSPCPSKSNDPLVGGYKTFPSGSKPVIPCA